MPGFPALFSDQTQTKGSSFFFWQVSLDSDQCRSPRRLKARLDNDACKLPAVGGC